MTPEPTRDKSSPRLKITQNAFQSNARFERKA
jgi:hypothetical protein